MQEVIDRATQKNLSRNVKESLTQDTRFWDKKDDEAKGNLGLGKTDNLRTDMDWGPKTLRQQKATTLQKTSLHRKRMDLINHRSVQQSRVEINAIRDRELSRLHRNFSLPTDAAQNQSDNEQFDQLMTKARRDAEDVLTVLDFQIETLQTAVDNGTATQEDRTCLQKLKEHHRQIFGGIQRIFRRARDVNNFGVFDNAADGVRRLDNYLQNSLAPDWDPLALPQKLSQLGSAQALAEAGKPKVETLSPKDQQRLQKSQRLGKLGSVLGVAIDGLIIQGSVRGLYGKQLPHSRETAPPGAVNWQALPGTEAADIDMRQDQPVRRDDPLSINRYAKTFEAAAKAGIELAATPGRNNNESFEQYFNRIKDDNDGLDLDGIFQRAKAKLNELKQEHRQLAEELKPTSRLKKAWRWIKAKFSTTTRKTATEVTAFSTEFGLANNEAHEAELKAKEPGGDDDHQGILGHDEPIPTPVYVAKDVLHVAAVVKNADDIVRLQQERHHLKHKQHVAQQKLQGHEQQREQMDPVEQHRSAVVKALYEKAGDQAFGMINLEQTVAGVQITRHLASLTHDTLVKSGVITGAVTIAGLAGTGGAAVVETAEGFIGAGKAIHAQKIKSHLNARIKEIQQEIARADDDDLREALRFQERTLKDLSAQQERLTNVVSSMKGFGMGAGYTLALLATLGVASTGVAAPVLLAVFAGTQVGLKAYKVAKASHQLWKIDRTEDLILGRGGGPKFLDGLMKESRKTGATPEQLALTRICRGKSPDAKRPSSRQMLHNLKWECRATRYSDDNIREINRVKQQIKLDQNALDTLNLPLADAQFAANDLRTKREQLATDAANHKRNIMQSQTAKILRDAYRLSEDEIVALVDAPNDDQYDEIGVRLINEYQQELTE